jgi:hypothetical protein
MTGARVSADDIAAYISSNGKKYIRGNIKPWSEDWIRKCDAPLLLHNIFSDLSQATVEFSKTTHSVELTRWILSNDPETLDELSDCVEELARAG